MIKVVFMGTHQEQPSALLLVLAVQVHHSPQSSDRTWAYRFAEPFWFNFRKLPDAIRLFFRSHRRWAQTSSSLRTLRGDCIVLRLSWVKTAPLTRELWFLDYCRTWRAGLSHPYRESPYSLDDLLSPQHLKLLLEVSHVTHKRKPFTIIDDHTAGNRFAFVEGAFLESRGRW